MSTLQANNLRALVPTDPMVFAVPPTFGAHHPVYRVGDALWSNGMQIAALGGAEGSVGVDDHGAVGDGVTDDADAIEAADLACPIGGTLDFGRGKRYMVARTTQIKRAHVVRYNGSTIVAHADLDAASILHGERLGKWSAADDDFEAFEFAALRTTFDLPDGITCSVGDYVVLLSSQESAPGYTHGIGSICTGLVGQVCTLIRPAYTTLTITGIEVWRGYARMVHVGGGFDVTATPNRPAFSVGLQVRGTNFEVSQCWARGSEYAGMGIWVDGDTGRVANCWVSGFVNLAGATGGGRIGYGVRTDASACTIDAVTTFDCKHGLSTSARNKMADGVTYNNCKIYERTDVWQSGRYSGSMDFHANCMNVSVTGESTEVIGALRLLVVRGPCKVRGGRWVQAFEGGLVEAFDRSYGDLDLDGMQYTLATANSAFIRVLSVHPADIDSLRNVRLARLRVIDPATAVGRLVDLQRVTAVDGLEITDCAHVGGSIFRHAGGSLRGLRITGLRDCVVNEAAVRLVLAGGTDVVDTCSIDGNEITRADYSGSESLIYAYSSTGTRVQATDLSLSGNRLTHSADTGTGYALNLSALDVDGLDMDGNRIRRGSFRAVAIGQCDVTDGHASGNVLGADGHWIIHGNPSATTLDGWVFAGNAGHTYQRSTAGGGVSTARYLADAAQNAFTTFAA